jgi:hypothetical protein
MNKQQLINAILRILNNADGRRLNDYGKQVDGQIRALLFMASQNDLVVHE